MGLAALSMNCLVDESYRVACVRALGTYGILRILDHCEVSL